MKEKFESAEFLISSPVDLGTTAGRKVAIKKQRRVRELNWSGA